MSFRRPDDTGGEVVGLTSAAAGSAPSAGADPPDGDAAPSFLRRLRSRQGRILVLGVAVVLLVAAVATALFATKGAPTTTVTPSATAVEPSPATSAAPASEPAGSGLKVDPTSTKAVAFLAALRRTPVPVSPSGQAEIEAAAVICEQLAGGTDPQTLTLEVPALLPTVPQANANDVVTVVSKTYC